MKKEFEEQQRKSPLAGGANPVSNFDIAGYLAGSGSAKSSTAEREPSPAASGGGGKSRRRG
jgi:hypothetical protein